jgi:hypothetical protein
VIWPDHRIWAIILTPPFEPIDVTKNGELFSLSWPWITIRYISCTKVCMVPYVLCSCTQSSISFKHGHVV